MYENKFKIKQTRNTRIFLHFFPEFISPKRSCWLSMLRDILKNQIVLFGGVTGTKMKRCQRNKYRNWSNDSDFKKIMKGIRTYLLFERFVFIGTWTFAADLESKGAKIIK